MKNNPAIQTIDTDFSKGRLNHQQTISLEDTAKFHGHLCDFCTKPLPLEKIKTNSF